MMQFYHSDYISLWWQKVAMSLLYPSPALLVLKMVKINVSNSEVRHSLHVLTILTLSLEHV